MKKWTVLASMLLASITVPSECYGKQIINGNQSQTLDSEGVLNGVSFTGQSAGNEGTLTVPSGNTINTNQRPLAIETDSSTFGLANFSGSATVNGQVGTTTELLGTLTQTGSGTVQFNGPVYAENYNLNLPQANVTFLGSVNVGGAPMTMQVTSTTTQVNSQIKVGEGLTFNGSIVPVSAQAGNLVLSNNAAIFGNVGTVAIPIGFIALDLTNTSGVVYGFVNNTVGGGLMNLYSSVNQKKNGTATVISSPVLKVGTWDAISGSGVLSTVGGYKTNKGSLTFYTNAVNADTVHYYGGTIGVTLQTNAVTSNTVYNPTTGDPVNPSYIVNTTNSTGTLPSIFLVNVNDPGSSNVQVHFASNGSIYATVSGFQQPSNIAAVNDTLLNAYNKWAAYHPLHDLYHVLTEIFELGVASDYENIMLQIDPISGITGVSQESFNTTRQFTKVWQEHLLWDRTRCFYQKARGCCEPCETVCSTPRFWAEGFGSYTHQGNKRGFNGYKADTWGTLFAVEAPLAWEGMRAGAGGGYAYTDINQRDYGNHTETQNFFATAYLNYDRDCWFMDGGVALGLNHYKTTRHFNFATVHRKAKSHYNGYEYSGFLTSGYQHVCGQFEIIPMAGMLYSYLHLAEMRETGARSLNLRIKSQNYQYWQSNLGVKAASFWEGCYGTLIPEVHTFWYYNFNRNPIKAHSTFYYVNFAENKYTNQGPGLDHNIWNIGTSLTCVPSERVSLQALYDFERSYSTYSHQGLIEVSLNF